MSTRPSSPNNNVPPIRFAAVARLEFSEQRGTMGLDRATGSHRAVGWYAPRLSGGTAAAEHAPPSHDRERYA